MIIEMSQVLLLPTLLMYARLAHKLFVLRENLGYNHQINMGSLQFRIINSFAIAYQIAYSKKI
jgi:hypothetical protein